MGQISKICRTVAVTLSRFGGSRLHLGGGCQCGMEKEGIASGRFELVRGSGEV